MILSILNDIASNNSKNFKLEELAKHKDNVLFQQVLKLAYCPVTQFYIRQIPEYDINVPYDSYHLQTALIYLNKIAHREITGNLAKNVLRDQLELLTNNDAEVLKRIIGKDLKAGFSASSINKVFGKGFIKETPYMGAVSYKKEKVEKLFKNHDKVFSEIKMDGRYTNIKITGDDVYMESRAGKVTNFGNTFDNLIYLRNMIGHDLVLNGELVIFGMSRYESNGAIAAMVSIGNKIDDGKDVTKELTKFEKEYELSYDELKRKITVVVWDFIPLIEYENLGYWRVPRINRLDQLAPLISDFLEQTSSTNIQLIKYREVKDVKEAIDHFQELIAEDEEGTILKGSNGTWKDGKPAWQVKFKLEMTVDLKIIGLNYGTPGSKNEKLISSILVESSCGALKTNPCGISEKDMKYITANQEEVLGSILEVKCSGTSSNSKGEYSLLHPVFIKIRDDKNDADSLIQIKENEDMIKNLK